MIYERPNQDGDQTVTTFSDQSELSTVRPQSLQRIISKQDLSVVESFAIRCCVFFRH